MLPLHPTDAVTALPFRTWLKIVISIVLAGVAISPLVRAGQVDDPVVMTINGEPVSAREYRLVMERQTAGVYGYFKAHHDLEDHVGYWSEASGPEGPLARLRQAVRAELVRIKVHQAIARQRGLVEKTTYADFHREFMAENLRRQEAHAQGQVIYGPPQYREATYYYIRLGDLVYKVQKAIAEELGPGITEEAIEAFYEANKGAKSLDEERTKIRALVSAKEAEKHLQALCDAARVEVDETALRSLVPRIDTEVSTSD